VVIAIVALVLSVALPGPSGASFNPATTLQHGQRESGVYSAWGANLSGYMGAAVNFRIPLAHDLAADNWTFVAEGDSFTTTCPGPGQSSPGQLCVYEEGSGGNSFEGIYNPAYSGGPGNVSKMGFGIYFLTTASAAWSYGSWTVEAP
jgi:hypothetical protein